MSHDRGVTFSVAPIAQRIASVISSADYSILFHLADQNDTYLYVTEDAGRSFAMRTMPGWPVV